MYATQQDLVARFGEQELIELTDRADPPAGAIDATVVDQALADAEELINSYVGKRYDLPLAAVPGAVKRTAADLARFYLYKDDPLEAVRKSFEDAVKWLKDIAAGRADLDIAGEEPAPAEAQVRISSPDRVFSRDTLEGF